VSLVAIVVQGTLGGLRVLENSPDLAFLHGAVGQAVFAAIGAVMVTSSRRFQLARTSPRWPRSACCRWRLLATAVVYLQIVLGAWLRHGRNDLVLLAHLLMVVLVVAAILVLGKALRGAGRAERAGAPAALDLRRAGAAGGAGHRGLHGGLPLRRAEPDRRRTGALPDAARAGRGGAARQHARLRALELARARGAARVLADGAQRAGGDDVREQVVAGERGALADWLTLTKPRIGSFIFLAALIGAALASGAHVPWGLACEAAFYVTCAAAAGSALNQVLERDTDRRMLRTCERPVAAGRIRMRDAILFGSTLALVGVAGLAVRFNLLAALLTCATLFAYVAVYTPLKRVSTLNTVVGALPGAAPPLLGYVALAAARALGLGALRADLRLAVPALPGDRLAPPRGLRARRLAHAALGAGRAGVASRSALVYALVLVPVALVPAVCGDASELYGLGALLASLCYAARALRFAWREDERNARLLLYVSLVYLPLVLGLALFDPVARGMSVLAHG
jgi:protoheme IX farnesyltransferase